MKTITKRELKKLRNDAWELSCKLDFLVGFTSPVHEEEMTAYQLRLHTLVVEAREMSKLHYNELKNG